ncbi:MAG TPA: NAD(P)/FAD-dependent oxidoreductase [Deltaproteobacteria bacterium]|jgi:flavin-dependent dehydrogenase|nr:NAD(P)/FAD-dependent oxidoreductase [Deltaproteobacteria bacterium]
MRSFDVLIVGGGPGGSSCAWKLRGSGLRVGVLDRATFPRDKVCAGWITPQVVEELELDLEEYAKTSTCQPFHGFRVGALGGEDVAVDYGAPVSFGIRRCEFDAHLLRRSGAELILGESVRSVRSTEGGWVVNDSLRASLLVGAGGHFCPVVRLLHPAPADPGVVVAAQEVEFPLDSRAAAACTVRPELPELYFMDDLRGYGWAVRKGAFLNVGLGRQDSHDLGAHVGRFLDFLHARGGLPPGSPRKLRGHAYLLYGLSPRPLVRDHLLLVGDAAGLADPRSGEGIRPAIESGLLAASVVLRAKGRYGWSDLMPYETAMVGRFGRRDARAVSALSALVPAALRPRIARWALASRFVAKHVILDRWFLHRDLAPLPAT